jgi:hypothetical protein
VRATGQEGAYSARPTGRYEVAGSSIRNAYVDLLLDRVRQEKYPNPDHLDRIEASAKTPEQLVAYVEVLMSRVEGMEHPSSSILNRLQRFAEMA